MNIDYALIIARANDRKNRLMELDDQLLHTASMLQKIKEVREWTAQVAELFRDLDREGRDLLPRDIASALEYSQNVVNQIDRAISDNCGGISAWSRDV